LRFGYVAGLVLVGAVGAGCDDAPATAPSPLAAEVTSIRLSGRVIDADGAAVPSATVTRRDASGGVAGSATADGNGRYEFALDATSPGSRFAEIALDVEYPGFEAGRYYAFTSGVPEARRDIRLHRVERFTAGDTIALRFTEEDAACDYGGEHLPCRRVRVVTATGLLSAGISSSFCCSFSSTILWNGHDVGSYFGTYTKPGEEIAFVVILLRPPSVEPVLIGTSPDYVE
jgi:hypothetical protein